MPPKKRKEPTIGYIPSAEDKKEPKKQKEAKLEEECIENVEMKKEKKKKNFIIYNLTEEEKQNKILYLPNDIVSIPIKRSGGIVVARTIVNLTDFKEKKLDRWTYRLNRGYAMSSQDIRLHELIMGKKAPKGFVIDHRNRDKMDNTRTNLRIITDALNSINKTKLKGTSSHFYGLKLAKWKNGNRWQSASRWNHKQYHLGTFDFDKALEAAKTYDRFILAVHGIEAKEATNTCRFPKEQLLTEDDIQAAIKSNPEDYLIKKKSDLPKNITKARGRFRIKLTRNLQLLIDEIVDTLEEAIEIRNKTIKEYKEKKKQAILNQKIKRNAQNEAILTTNKTSGTSYDFTVDDDDYYYLFQYGWTGVIDDTQVVITGTVDGVMRKVYDVVWRRYHPNEVIPEGWSIDHIDRSHLNVKSSNLRLLDKSNQAHNRKLPSKSEMSGAYPSGNRWISYIRVKTQKIDLGIFDTKAEAGAAYKAASNLYYPGTMVVD